MKHKSKNVIMRLFSVLILLIFTTEASAQFSFERDNSIPVQFAGNTLHMPWAGGLNYAQFSEIDMDFDGRTDLFVFDRSDDQIRIFLSKEVGGVNRYVEAPEYRFSFPSDIRYRCALVDYNADGLPDIFTYGIGGIKVYKNSGNAITGHQWELASNLIYSNYYGSMGNLFVSSSDIPAIVDVDGDGDMDVLTFHIGGEYLEYHKNMSMENFGVPDSLHFVLMNECWGNFRENESTNSIILNSNIFPCGSGGSNVPNPEISINDTIVIAPSVEKENRHAGSTILAIDMNNSGLKDLILGDISFPNLVLLINGGTDVNTNSNMISVDYNFPSNTTSSNLSLFPAGYFVDSDHDGVKDLIVAPNAKIVSENQRSIWRYKNLGTNENPTFVYQQNDFLQNQMIDVGSGSIPVLVDVNGDGLTDLLVANFFTYKAPIDKDSRFMYFQNTGTAENPVFTYVENDKFAMSDKGLGLRIIPTFGDVDNDGDLDMIVGSANGRVHLFINTAGAGNPMVFDDPIYNLVDTQGNQISAGSFSAPSFVDLNRDGLVDLVVGTKNGRLMYYQNTGSAENYQFTLINSMLGEIDVDPSPDGYATPTFVEIDGEWHLFIGARDGKMHYYTGIEGNLSPGDVFSFSSTSFASIDVDGYSSFAIQDIDNDGNLELFVGTDLGGVELFKADPNSSVGIDNIEEYERVINSYPNPFEDEIIIEGVQNGDVVKLYTMSGKIVHVSIIENNVQRIDVHEIRPGIYFLEINSSGAIYRSKVIK